MMYTPDTHSIPRDPFNSGESTVGQYDVYSKYT